VRRLQAAAAPFHGDGTLFGPNAFFLHFSHPSKSRVDYRAGFNGGHCLEKVKKTTRFCLELLGNRVEIGRTYCEIFVQFHLTISIRVNFTQYIMQDVPGHIFTMPLKRKGGVTTVCQKSYEDEETGKVLE